MLAAHRSPRALLEPLRCLSSCLLPRPQANPRTCRYPYSTFPAPIRPFAQSSLAASQRRHASTKRKVAPAETVEDLLSEPSSLPTSPAPVSSVELRPYQQAAIDACLDGLADGLTRMGVSSPTGSGKTTMFMKLIPQVVQREGKRKQTLILVNAIELAHQASGAARRILGPEWSVEVEQGSRIASGKADVTIATFQTLTRSEDRLLKFDPADFGLVIIDEAHHAAAKSFMRALHYFHEDVQLPSSVEPVLRRQAGSKVPTIGFSATFSRPDQLALSSVFEQIVFHREIKEMLRDGWLSPAKSTTVKAELDLARVEDGANGDFRPDSLADQLNTPEINELIVRSYLHLAEQRRSTLVFCVDLNHVDNIVQAFRTAGVDARSISSRSKSTYRRDTLNAFMGGDFPVLVNCEVLTEGADIPVIDCLILARPTRSKNLLSQMIGRGLRLSPDTGKEDCHIIDVADSMSDGLTVSPTLLGISHDTLDEMEAERERQEKAESEDGEIDVETAATRRKGDNDDYSVSFTNEADPFGLAGDAETRKSFMKMSYNAWVSCGSNKFILETMTGSQHIKIMPTPNDSPHQSKFTVTHVVKEPQMHAGRATPKAYTHAIHIAGADELQRAFEAGDTFATKLMGREMVKQLSRNAPWRMRPATERAKNFLLTLNPKRGDSATMFDGEGKVDTSGTVKLLGRTIEINKLTAGEVSALLCGAKHGAWKEKKKLHDRAAAKQLKLDLKAAKLNKVDLPLPAAT